MRKRRSQAKQDEARPQEAHAEPRSDLGNLTPRAFVIVYIWPHWHDNRGSDWTIGSFINDLDTWADESLYFVVHCKHFCS